MVKVRVQYTSDQSGNVYNDDYDVTFRSACWGNTFTKTSTDAVFYTYDIDSDSDSIAPIFSTV